MIMRRMNIRGLLVLLTLIPFYIPDLSAQTPVTERETLRGLKGFYVFVEEQRDEIKQAGLTKGILRTDVELKLRKAGIRVLTKDEMFLMQGTPQLLVDVTAFKTERVLDEVSGFIYSVNIDFMQRVLLSRNRSIKATAITWQRTFLGITPKLRHIRETVSDLIDDFMNDYLAANPK